MQRAASWRLFSTSRDRGSRAEPAAWDTFFLNARRPQLSGKKEGDVSSVLQRWVEPFTRSVGRLSDRGGGYSRPDRDVKFWRADGRSTETENVNSTCWLARRCTNKRTSK